MNQIYNLFVDLASITPLLDVGSKGQHGESGPSNSKGQKGLGVGAASYKGKKAPSLASCKTPLEELAVRGPIYFFARSW